MKATLTIAIVIMLAAFLLTEALAQATQRSVANDIGVYVYPAKGQKAEQQSQDEVECYSWATKSTGSDPFDLAKQKQKQDQDAAKAKQDAANAGKGSGAKGAVGGAAAGALIGAVAGDAGKGAAIGATAGVIAGRRKGKQAQAQASASADAQAKSGTADLNQQMSDFKKAFSVCLEARNYMVK